jgi:hypothetical protein
MATTYYAANYSDPIPTFPGVGVTITREFLYTISVAFVLSDVVKLCKIPPGVVVTDYYVAVPDLDTSTGVRVKLGDNDDDDEFVAAADVGQVLGVLTLGVNGVTGSMPRSYTAANDFAFKISTAATGTAATSGVIRGWLRYHFMGITSPAVAV